MAGFFPVFFQKFWSVGVTPTETTSRLGYANAVAGLVIALLAPVLGAIADRGGRRKQFLFAWTLLGVAATGALYFVGQGQWFAALALFVLGTIGFNGGVVFNDSLLLDVAKAPGPRPRVRLRLLAGLPGRRPAVPRQRGDGQQARSCSGCADSRAGRAGVVRHGGGLVAAVHDAADALACASSSADRTCRFGDGHARRVSRARAAPSRTCASTAPCVMFLLAYWFYIDGVNTIIKMAVNYGIALGLDTGSAADRAAGDAVRGLSGGAAVRLARRPHRRRSAAS